MIIKSRTLAGPEVDDQKLLELSIDEIDRLAGAELAFVLPSVTLIAEQKDLDNLDEFMQRCRSELGKYHRYMNSGWGNHGSRKWSRTLKKHEHWILVGGVLINEGKLQKFAAFEKHYRRYRHTTNVRSGRDESQG